MFSDSEMKTMCDGIYFGNLTCSNYNISRTDNCIFRYRLNIYKMDLYDDNIFGNDGLFVVPEYLTTLLKTYDTYYIENVDEDTNKKDVVSFVKIEMPYKILNDVLAKKLKGTNDIIVTIENNKLKIYVQ